MPLVDWELARDDRGSLTVVDDLQKVSIGFSRHGCSPEIVDNEETGPGEFLEQGRQAAIGLGCLQGAEQFWTVEVNGSMSVSASLLAQGASQVGLAHHAAPGMIGKSHLAQAIGYQAIKAGFHVLYTSIFDLVRELQADLSPAEMDHTLTRYLKPDLLIIDDMGLKVLPSKSGEVMLEVVMRRYEVRSTLMTSNRPIEEWGKLLNDVPASSAILDRLLHHADIIEVSGRSYRLHQAAQKGNKNCGLAAVKKK
jgi:hypothetical protein